MTTAFVGHSLFPDGETEAHSGEHAQGLQRLTVAFQTEDCPDPTAQLQKGLEGTLPMQALGSCGPGDKGVSQLGAWDLRFGEGTSQLPQSGVQCLRKVMREPRGSLGLLALEGGWCKILEGRR